MVTPNASLIEQLRERASDRERATDMQIDIARPPVSKAELDSAEASLGFRLPQLLRELYHLVGNGGFGPGYGLIELLGSATSKGESVVENYLRYRFHNLNLFHPTWPERLLPISEWGCAIGSCVDCSKPDAPVVRHDPHFEDDDEYGSECTSEYGTESLWVECSSLQAWLEAWLEGTELFSAGRKPTNEE